MAPIQGFEEDLGAPDVPAIEALEGKHPGHEALGHVPGFLHRVLGVDRSQLSCSGVGEELEPAVEMLRPDGQVDVGGIGRPLIPVGAQQTWDQKSHTMPTCLSKSTMDLITGPSSGSACAPS